MKLIALAAVLAMGAPALAQDMPEQDTMTAQDGATTNPAPGQSAPPPPATSGAPMDAPTNQTMPSPAAPPPAAAPAAPMSPAAPAAPATGADPVGGYQPSAPPLSGSPAAGQQVIFQASQSPDQAYPAPAPLAEYPVCKRGQTDKCRNPGGR